MSQSRGKTGQETDKMLAKVRDNLPSTTYPNIPQYLSYIVLLISFSFCMQKQGQKQQRMFTSTKTDETKKESQASQTQERHLLNEIVSAWSYQDYEKILRRESSSNPAQSLFCTFICAK